MSAKTRSDIDVNVTFPADKRVDASIGGFTVCTDRPVDDGGEGKVPTPFQLFWAALGTCAGHYALGFCDQRDIPSDGLALSMHCTYDEKTQLYTKVVTSLTLPEGFPDKYRTAITRAVEACYVKKHVENAPEFSVEIVG